MIALQDRNRNTQADPGEVFAVPPTQTVHTTEDTTFSELQWIVTKLDTVPPVLDRAFQRVTGILEARFSEPVILPDTDAARWSLTDSVSGVTVPVASVFQLEDEPFRVLMDVRTVAEGTYFVNPDTNIADSSGNAIGNEAVSVYLEQRNEDLGAPELLRFLPEEKPGEIVILLAHQNPGLAFNRPPGLSALDTLVTVHDSTGTTLPVKFVTENGTSYQLHFDPPIPPGALVQVAYRDTLRRQTYQRIEERETGSLSGSVQLPNTLLRLLLRCFVVTQTPSHSQRSSRILQDGLKRSA